MRRRHHPSFLILRRRPRRIKGNRAIREWFMSLRREHELKALRRDLDHLQQTCMADFYARSTQGTYIVDLQQRYRELDLQATLNREEIAGLKAREVPGWGAKEKAMAFDLTNKNSEEIEVLQDAQDIQRAQINRLGERVADIERAIGEEPNV